MASEITSSAEFARYFKKMPDADPLKKELQEVFIISKDNHGAGTRISRDRWPKSYIKKYDITCLWKYNLSGGWRLIYTTYVDDNITRIAMIEVFPHKEYERRFGY